MTVVGKEVRRGRPPRLSRDAILMAALDMLEREPDLAFSLNGLARALKVTPMALYTYFGSRDDLLQALTERLLSGFVTVVDGEMPAIRRVEAWCFAARRFFLGYPQLLGLLTWEGGNTSVAWFDRSVVLIEALQELGFKDAELSRAIIWIWTSVMGAISEEIRNRTAPHSLSPAQVESLDPRLHKPVRDMLMLAEQPDHFDSFFAYHVERLLDALGAIATRP